MRIPNKTAKTEQNSGLRGRVNASTEDLRFGVGGLATYGGGGSGENGLGKKGETGDMLSNRVKGLGVGGGERRCLVSPMTRNAEGKNQKERQMVEPAFIAEVAPSALTVPQGVLRRQVAADVERN